MSTYLRATPDTAARSVLLDLGSYPAGQALAITRTDANGARKVRLPRGAAPDANGAYTVRDHEVALAGSVAYKVQGTRTNEIANGSFTTDLTGWSSGGPGASIARDTTTGHTGVTSLRLDSTSAGANAQYGTKVAIPAAVRVPATHVTLAVYAKGSGNLQLEAQGQNSSNVPTVSASSALIPLTAEWQRVQVRLSIDANTAKVLPIIFQRAGGTLSMWVDSVLCEINSPSTSPGYFAGTFTNQGITATTSLEDAARDAGPWIHAAAYPTTLATLTGGLVVDWRPTTDTGAQLVDVIGRADAIDTGPALARTRAHTVDVRCPDLAAARELEQLVTAARTIVLRHNTAGLDTTLTVESLDGPHPDPANPRRWHVILRGREALTGPYLADPPT